MAASYYQILCIAPTASAQEIARAYRQLALQNHPDLGGDAGAMVSLNQAYEVLGDPEQRRIYDEFLGLGTREAGPAWREDGAAPGAAVEPPGWEPLDPDEEPVVPEDGPPAPSEEEASLALGLLRSLFGLVDGFVSLLLRLMSADSLPWLICYALVLAGIAAVVNSIFSRVRFP